MQKFSIIVLLALALAACKSEADLPDVSGIAVSTKIIRFDQAFFNLDTNNIDAGMNALNAAYPQFFGDYLTKIVGIDPRNPDAMAALKPFLYTYKQVYDTARLVAEKALPGMEKDLQKALQYMQYYVPAWKPEIPFEIITFIGPMDAYESFPLGDYGDVRTSRGVGVALQLHLGSEATIYEDGRSAGIFYDYQTRRFTPNTMVVNAMKNVISDAFPYKAESLGLVEDMIEKGKRLVLLEKVLPATPDSLLLGYTGRQLKGCEANEALIWNYFVKNDLLYSKDPMLNQNYLKDGPKTAELGEGAPGYIGLFVGRQIARAYLKKFSKTTITEFMKIPAKEVLDNAGYKP
jgi:hypothetical protein